MDKRKTGGFPVRYLLFILSFLCLGLIGVHYLYPDVVEPIRAEAESVLMPLQIGLNKIGTQLSDRFESYMTLKNAQTENERLKEENEQLKEDNLLLYEKTYELQELQELLKMKDQYASYEMVGANVIQKETGNWFHEFIIDKGTDDGVFVDANVIAGGALVGRVISVGKNYARVLSIIDDDCSVGAMSQETGDFCIVTGDLSLYQEGKIRFDYAEKEAVIEEGNLLVTSYVSDIYLPNLAIGYVETCELDSNNLTRSGTVIPIVDFSSLDKVMVITTSKEDWMQETEAAE